MFSLRKLRIYLLVLILILMSLGSIMVFNSTAVKAYEYYQDSFYFFKRHVFFLCLGLVAGLFIMRLNKDLLQRLAKPAVAVSVLLLLLVLLPQLGRKVAGAQRWFNLGPFSFQPSELAKVTIVMYLADYLSRKRHEITSFIYGFLPAMLIVGAAVGLILLEPDLGTAVLIFAVSVFMLYAGGARLGHLLSLGLMAAPAVFYLVALKPYRLRRIIAFIDPWQHKADAGYQLVQSLITLGSGGLWGVGLGQGQQKLYYLPAAHTDFIFSIIGEELGFVGAGLLVLIYAFMFVICCLIAIKLASSYSKLVVMGMSLLLGLQAVIHVGTSTGSIPTKGLPLPFVSYGGSSLLFNIIAAAIIFNVSREDNI